MYDKKYDISSCDVYQKLPRLISGLKEKCLVKLIEINLFKIKIVPEKRE